MFVPTLDGPVHDSPGEIPPIREHRIAAAAAERLFALLRVALSLQVGSTVPLEFVAANDGWVIAQWVTGAI